MVYCTLVLRFLPQRTYQGNYMNALQKVAWVELIVSLVAVATALALYPWFGDHAAGAIWILGLLGICPLIMLQEKGEVVSDERDRAIELRSTYWGQGAAWLLLSLSILAVGMWHSWIGQEVPAKYVIALVYIHLAVYFAVKGAYSLVCYGRSERAAQTGT